MGIHASTAGHRPNPPRGIKGPRRSSARAILTAGFLVAGVLPLLLFGAVFWPTLSRHLESDLESASRSALIAASIEVETSIFARPRGFLPTILMLADSYAGRLGRLLEAFAASRPEYDAFLLLDAEGRVEAAQRKAGVEPGTRYELRFRPSPGALAASEPYEREGRLLLELGYANPRRTAVAVVDLGDLSSRLALLTRTPSDRIAVVDGSGRYVLCSDPSLVLSGAVMDPAVLAGEAAPGERVDEGGQAFFAFSARVPGTDWRAVYLSSVEEASAPLRSFFWRMGIVVALTLAAAALAAAWLSRSVSGPLEGLVSRIGLIAAGRYGERLPPGRLLEFEKIGAAVNAMAESIQRRDGEILRSEERYRLLFHANRVPALLVRARDSRIADANAAAEAYYGYDAPALRDLSLSDLDELGAGAGAALESAGRTGEGYLSRHRLRPGESRDVEVHVGPLTIGDEPCFYAVIFDVTRRRVAEERTEAALKEKTLLLKEVYHRVKNNLQIISSLLSMQAGESSDEAVAAALREGQDRVYAMSLVHELVYQMGDLSSIDAAEYAARLALHAADAYSCPRERVELGLASLELGLERAIPFGLALNEMLSNAFKYGGGRRIWVSLEIGESEEGRTIATLSVCDEGPGISLGTPDGEPGDRPSSLGIPLVQGLAEQLRGSAAWTPGRGGRGTRVALAFPALDRPEPTP